MNRFNNLIENIKSINIDDVKWSNAKNREKSVNIVEEQKVYVWIRVYINDENLDIKPGDNIIIKYLPNSEKLESQFICYGKKGLMNDHVDEIVNYVSEDDNKILCLMVDVKSINYNDEIPFIRTLFKCSNYYEEQLLRRSDLIFENERTKDIIDYYDVEW